MADQKISALTSYTQPLDADVVPIVDTANTTTKKLTWANIKATLKTYFDTIYTTTAAVATQITTALTGYLTAATAASTYQPIALVGSTATTFTFDGSGGTTGSITLRIQKIGDWVTIFLPANSGTSGTSSTKLTSNTAVDAAYRPTTDGRAFFGAVNNNGSGLAPAGYFIMASTGIITVFRDAAGTAFTNTSTCGWNSFSITYYVGTGS